MKHAKTYGAMTTTPTSYVITAVQPHVAIRLKHIFPKIPKGSGPPYKFRRDDQTAADLSWFLQRYPMAAEQRTLIDIERRRRAYEEEAAEIERIFLPEYVAPDYAGLREGSELRDYQKRAIELLRRSRGLMLGDDVGLGKTYTAAGACLMLDALPAVVVCHAHLQAQWVRVIEQFTTLRCFAPKVTRPHDVPESDVIVIRYTQLAGWADVLTAMDVGLVAYDEIQELRRGCESQKGCAANRLSRHARFRLGLSATPIYNYGSEIYEIMRFLAPDVLGEQADFMREFAPYGSIADPVALGSYLRDEGVFLRRTKPDVGQELPKVNRIVDTVDFDAATMRSVEDTARVLAQAATTGSFAERGQAARQLDLRLRHTTGVAKAKAVAQVARILIEGGEPIVLAGWHRDVYEIWLDELADLKPALYTGSETAKAKDETRRRFVEGETDLMIMSLRSGAGLDGLQERCSTIVFGELDWSPGVHHQCIGRLDREGQTEPVTALFLVCDDGSDPPMMDVLGLKSSEQSAIVDMTLEAQQAPADRTRLQMLVERYLNKAPRKSARVVKPAMPAIREEQRDGVRTVV